METPNGQKFFNNIERIIDKRFIGGKTEYLLKWKGLPQSKNSWIPLESLDCPQLIASYEASKINKNVKNEKKNKDLNRLQQTQGEEDEHKESRGQEDGFTEYRELQRQIKESVAQKYPLEVVAITHPDGTICYKIKWYEDEEFDFEEAENVSRVCPRSFINYHAKRGIFFDHQPNKFDRMSEY